MITTNDISKAVANVIPALKQACDTCCVDNFFKDYCDSCDNEGWIPTKDLETIIMNIEYPFTLVLSNDMIGWYASITLEGINSNSTAKVYINLNTYNNPISAIYEALFETLTNSLETLTNPLETLTNSISEGRIKHPRRTRGRGRLIKSNRISEESVS